MWTVDVRNAGDGTLEISICGPSGQNVSNNVTAQGPGLFLVNYVPVESGQHRANVTFNKESIRGSLSGFLFNLVSRGDYVLHACLSICTCECLCLCLYSVYAGARPGSGSEGSGPTAAPAHGRFYIYVLNDMDVVITIIYSQKYVLFDCSDWAVWVLIAKKFSLEIASFLSYHMVQGSYIWDYKYFDR